jgi:hypothetical protein
VSDFFHKFFQEIEMWRIQGIIIDIDGHNVRYYWIPNFGGAYVIGDDGSIWSRHKRAGFRWVLSDDWEKMYPVPDGAGYLNVLLSINGIKRNKNIHKLVCEAVYGPCPPGEEACHNDGNKFNNNWWNLRWDLPENNGADKVIHGTSGKGENNPNVYLNWKKVGEIRAKWSTGKHTIKSLALEYGVSMGCISGIIYNKTWVKEHDLII